MDIAKIQDIAHTNARTKGFWKDFQYFYRRGDLAALNASISQKLALIMSEPVEALNRLRTQEFDLDWDYKEQISDDFGEELADIVLRTLDLAGGLEINLADKIAEKIKINKGRPKVHGKNF